MRCLVTGGRGLLGREIGAALAKAGFEIVAPPHADLDVTRLEDWVRLTGDFEAVVHAAAFIPSPSTRPEDLHRMLEVNALGAHRALEWAKRKNVRRFVYCSSASIYAPGVPLPIREDAETAPKGGAALYALGKLWGEQLCEAFRDGGLSTTCLRLAAIYGPEMSQGVVRVFWDRAGRGEELVVAAPRASADFVYVEDAAQAVTLAVRAETPELVYNVGGGTETTLAELARAVWDARQPGSTPLVREENGTGRRFLLDIARARRSLGYAPAFSLADGLRAWAKKER
jgi:nucleoside-diphosphate-sugar epimerase